MMKERNLATQHIIVARTTIYNEFSMPNVQNSKLFL